jgi:subtilisin family serine protease
MLAIGKVQVECVAPMPPRGVYAAFDGTSMASPHVAGVAGIAIGEPHAALVEEDDPGREPSRSKKWRADADSKPSSKWLTKPLMTSRSLVPRP